MPVLRVILLILLILLGSSCREKTSSEAVPGESQEAVDIRKVLYVDSYTRDLPWVQGILEGIEEVLLDTDDLPFIIKLTSIHMDTKRNPSVDSIKKSALEVKELIETLEPDAVILSDDNAVKYVLAAHYMESEIPFVFCGVNWDTSAYGLPASNVTGMIEVQLIPELVSELSFFALGDRVGFLKGDTYSSRVEGEHFQRVLGTPLLTSYVRTFEEWKKEYIRLQDECDILLLGNLSGIPDWNGETAALSSFLKEETAIPTGSWDRWMADKVLITLATQPGEQGEWVASSVLEILGGRPPAEIPLTSNKRASLFLNMSMALDMDIKFPMSLIDKSHMVK